MHEIFFTMGQRTSRVCIPTAFFPESRETNRTQCFGRAAGAVGSVLQTDDTTSGGRFPFSVHRCSTTAAGGPGFRLMIGSARASSGQPAADQRPFAVASWQLAS